MELRFGIHTVYSTFPHCSASVSIRTKVFAILGASGRSYHVYLSLN